MFGRLRYAGIEIKIVRGEANKTLSLDDVARCLGFEAADEVLPSLDVLKISDEKYRVPLGFERGHLYMISVAGAIKLAEGFDSANARNFATFLGNEMDHWEQLRYNGLPHVEPGILLNPPRDPSHGTDKQAGLPPAM